MMIRAYAKITITDVQRLQAAEDKLVAVGETIRASGYKSAPLLLANLAEVIESIGRVRSKGAGAIAREMQRKGVELPGEPSETPGDSQDANQEPLMRPEVEEA